MILRMAQLRILGPVASLKRTIQTLQDLEVLHLAPPCTTEGCRPLSLTEEQRAAHQRLERAVADLEAVRRLLAPHASADRTSASPPETALAAWPRRAAELRAELEELDGRARALEEERALLQRYQEMVRGFGPLAVQAGAGTRAWYLVLRADEQRAVSELQRALAAAIGDAVELLSRRLSGGDVAIAILAPVSLAPRVDALLAETSLEDLGAPLEYGGGSLTEALPRMLERLEALPGDVAAVRAAQQALASDNAGPVADALAANWDDLAALEALGRSACTDHAFVLEGWAPEAEVARMTRALAKNVGPTVVVERVGIEEWAGRETPVKLHNPKIFRPFEAITGLLPLPAYGTLDPTPFVAIGFPMMFGIILGDVAYGIVLGAIAVALHLRSRPETTLRAVSAIAGSCALFTVIFGVMYGELLGDLGRRWFGMQPLALDREEAILPALILALGIGFVHVLLGLVLGVVSAARGDPRKAVGRGLAAVMVVLVVIALLAVFGVLPTSVYSPILVIALIAFPALVVAEGLLAPIELLGTLANILSYARIMAVGTASVMMAVVANRMAGAMGSVLVGVLFALLFHLVNFTIGVFGPAVHVLRLHYVEFFGKFFSPGGTAYRPLRHWHPPRTVSG